MLVGETIKEIRTRKNLTQKKLGELCIPPIAESTIRRYELGKLNPKIETLQKIADALGISLYELYLPELNSTIESSKNISDKDQLERLTSYLMKLNSLGLEKAEQQLEKLINTPEYSEKER